MINDEINNCLEMNGTEFEMVPMGNSENDSMMRSGEEDLFRIFNMPGGFGNIGIGANPLQGMGPMQGFMPGGFDTPLNPLDSAVPGLLEGPLGLQVLQNYYLDEKKKPYLKDDDYDYLGKKGSRDVEYGDVRAVVRKIERYNPGVFRRLMRYGIPYYEARNIVRRIVRLTLLYDDMD